AVARAVSAATGPAAGAGTKTGPRAGPDAGARTRSCAAARSTALRHGRRPGRRFNRARQRIDRRCERFGGNVELFDRIGFDLGLLERGLFFDRNRELVLTGQLGFLWRLLHLVAATTAAAAGTGFAQPDDVFVGFFRQYRRD